MLRSYLADFDNLADDWCQFKRTNIEEYDHLMDSMMDSLYYRIVYIYRNGLLLSSAVALHFSTVLSENPEVYRKLLQKKKIVRICSIGGGSASDVVAIVSVLEALAEDLDIRVTILDRDGRWKNTSFVVLRCLKTFRNATWRINFLTCDLSGKELNPEAALAVKNADVVTMVKFISEFEGNRKDLQSTIKNTINIISPGSMLFVLDVAVTMV
ncbi:hypothetical protein JTE90_004884 [Oedothorax gibbosus]|uniref:Uncharacterized protein n=1 Tax=Oedothorax gibbosus TaxID=931172 RepID=A0AAV6UV68_9ARAC|nr:hypothetical protein JTE90_004884 [Oedothorax gibbosus]